MQKLRFFSRISCSRQANKLAVSLRVRIFVIQTYYKIIILLCSIWFVIIAIIFFLQPITLRTIKHPARITGFDLVRRNATRDHVYDDDDDDDPVTESTTWLSPRRCHLVESILPRDALPAETASYARKRSGTTACLASIRSSRLVHRVFLYRDLPPGPHRNRNTPREQLPEDPGDTHLPAARSAVSSPCALIFFFIFDRV